MSTEEHGANGLYHDNIGIGWRIECLCGWASLSCLRVQDAGEELVVGLFLFK